VPVVQVLPYMRFAKDDPDLSRLLCGVVRRQAYSVALNPYANAFNYNNSKYIYHAPAISKWIFTPAPPSSATDVQ
jgi:meiotically up-regulated gene 157 (Mug157) protein